MRKIVGIPLVMALAVCTACSSRFSQADVEQTESDIRAQFEQKGFIVEQVSMVRDSDRHMAGFARMRKPGLILSRLDLTKNCTATKDETSGRSIWQCK
jgi:hypothetical protein